METNPTSPEPDEIRQQYRNAANLNARIRLHLDFSTNQYGWQRWLFDQFDFPLRPRVLELGCGAGNLWLDNLERIPHAAEIILSDFSPGMLAQAQDNLSRQTSGFQFRVIDAQAIPFEAQRFDVVIANHMLYHVPDKCQALREITRVLKPGGRFYASTVGLRHLKELGELIERFDARLIESDKLSTDSFTLENGAALLGEYFDEVTLQRYPDALIVTDASLLFDYILSGLENLTSEQQAALAGFVGQELQANQGKYYITKDSGVFAGRRPTHRVDGQRSSRTTTGGKQR